MTRDQAIDVFASAIHDEQQEYYHECKHRVAKMIDGFAALGILKLDGPDDQRTNDIDP